MTGNITGRVNIILAAVLLLLIAFGFFYHPPAVLQEMKEENLTVVTAPDQTKSMEHPDFVKEEFIPVIPAGSNIALGMQAAASSFEATYTPRKVTDGNAGGVSYWEGAKDSYPNWIEVEFEEARSVHAVRVLLNPQNIWGRREQTFSVEVSSDGETYEEVVAEAAYVFDPDLGNETVVEFGQAEARYVRLIFTANSGSGGGQVAELEVYGE